MQRALSNESDLNWSNKYIDKKRYRLHFGKKK